MAKGGKREHAGRKPSRPVTMGEAAAILREAAADVEGCAPCDRDALVRRVFRAARQVMYRVKAS